MMGADEARRWREDLTDGEPVEHERHELQEALEAMTRRRANPGMARHPRGSLEVWHLKTQLDLPDRETTAYPTSLVRALVDAGVAVVNGSTPRSLGFAKGEATIMVRVPCSIYPTGKVLPKR